MASFYAREVVFQFGTAVVASVLSVWMFYVLDVGMYTYTKKTTKKKKEDIWGHATHTTDATNATLRARLTLWYNHGSSQSRGSMNSPYKVYRKTLHKALLKDPRARQLYKIKREFNKYAREVEGWTELAEKYSVDHIEPLEQGGANQFDNLWICPLHWNILCARFPRGVRTIEAIHREIKRDGRVHLAIPNSVLAAQRQDKIDYLRSIGIKVDDNDPNI